MSETLTPAVDPSGRHAQHTLASNGSTAGSRSKRSNPSPVSCDYAEPPGKIRVRLNQCQCYFRRRLRRIRREAEPDNSATGWEPSPENQFAEILVEGEEDLILSCTEHGDVLIRGARALFCDCPDVPTGFSKRFQRRLPEVFVGQKPHVAFSGKTCSSRNSSLA